MVSCEDSTSYRADLVRLVHGDPHPDGPGFREEEVPSAVAGEHRGRVQPIPIGSYVDVDDPGGLLDLRESFTLFTFVWPTLPGRGEQALLGRWGEGGYLLTLDAAGRLVLRVGEERAADEVATTEPLARRVWYAVAATLDASTGKAAVEAVPVVNSFSSLVGPIAAPAATAAEGTVGAPPAGGGRFLLAARGQADGTVTSHFNGKLDRPRVYARALERSELAALGRLEEPPGAAPVAAWDFAEGIGPAGIPSDRVADTTPNGLDGTCVNLPARAMTGVNWVGPGALLPPRSGGVRGDSLPRGRPRGRLLGGRPRANGRAGAAERRVRRPAARGRGRGAHPLLRSPPAGNGERRRRHAAPDGLLHGLHERPPGHGRRPRAVDSRAHARPVRHRPVAERAARPRTVDVRLPSRRQRIVLLDAPATASDDATQVPLARRLGAVGVRLRPLPHRLAHEHPCPVRRGDRRGPPPRGARAALALPVRTHRLAPRVHEPRDARRPRGLPPRGRPAHVPRLATASTGSPSTTPRSRT